MCAHEPKLYRSGSGRVWSRSECCGRIRSPIIQPCGTLGGGDQIIIEPGCWQVTILPLPKRTSRGVAYGFCGGHPVGRAEALRGKVVGCWWPSGQPELHDRSYQKTWAVGVGGGAAIGIGSPPGKPGQFTPDVGLHSASVAWAIEVRDDALRVCGSANHYEAIHPGTPHESHAVPIQHPVLWTARLVGL